MSFLFQHSYDNCCISQMSPFISIVHIIDISRRIKAVNKAVSGGELDEPMHSREICNTKFGNGRFLTSLVLCHRLTPRRFASRLTAV